MRKILRKTLLLLLLLCCVVPVCASSNLSALLDSMRIQVGTAVGKEKIGLLTQLAWLSGRGGDFDQLETECLDQQDSLALALAYAARVRTVGHLYPHEDSVLVLSRKIIEKINRPATSYAYASIRSMIIEHYLYTNRIKQAQEEVVDLLAVAHQTNDSMITAMAAYTQGRVFYALQQFASASGCFERALVHCPSYTSGKIIPLRVYIDIVYWNTDSYIRDSAYVKAEQTLKEAFAILDFMGKSNRNDLTAFVPIRCYSLQAQIDVHQGEMAQARKHLNQCEALMVPRIPMRLYADYFVASYTYHMAQNSYFDALADLDICLRNADGRPAYYFYFLKKKAELLPKIGRANEGVALLERYIEASDSIYQAEIVRQADQVRAEFHVEEITNEKNQIIGTLLVCLVVCGLILFLSVRYIYNQRALAQKNRILVHNIEQLDAIGGEQALRKMQVSQRVNAAQSDQEQIDPEEQDLYERIDKYLNQEHQFADYTITRDSLASEMGTNRTYVAVAIKKCTGLTVSEYVNMLRLEYARKLLLDDRSQSILQVSECAGFGSARNFNRLFVERYGISPTEYRHKG